MRPAHRHPDSRLGGRGWAAAVALPLAVSGILTIARGELFSTNASLALVVTVLAAALVGGRQGGAIAAVVAALCFDFFFTMPYYSFTITRRADVETTVALLLVGLVAGELVVRARRSDRRAAESEREVAQIRHVAELAAGDGRAGRFVTIVTEEVVAVLGAREARFERPPYRTVLPQLGHGRITVPGAREADGRPFGPDGELELPVCGAGRELGRLVVVMPGDRPTSVIPEDDRAFARVLVDQLGAALAAAQAG